MEAAEAAAAPGRGVGGSRVEGQLRFTGLLLTRLHSPPSQKGYACFFGAGEAMAMN